MKKHQLTQEKYFEELNHIYYTYGDKEAKRFMRRTKAVVDDTDIPTMSTYDCLIAITDYLLGPGWYCMDTGCQQQANPLILEAIMNKYRGY